MSIQFFNDDFGGNISFLSSSKHESTPENINTLMKHKKSYVRLQKIVSVDVGCGINKYGSWQC